MKIKKTSTKAEAQATAKKSGTKAEDNTALTERLALLDMGYEPLPADGKAIYARGWPTAKITKKWLRENRPDDENTGLRCGQLVSIDIDVWDANTVDAIKTVIRKYVDDDDDPWCERVGSKGAAILFRVDGEQPFAGLAVRAKPEGAALLKRLKKSNKGRPKLKDVEKVEFLGKGKQIIAYGVHPDTGKQYLWAKSGDPLITPFKDLPSLSVDDLKKLAKDIAEAMEEHGYAETVVTGDELLPGEVRKARCSGEPVTRDQMVERLRLISANWEWLLDTQGKNGRDLWVAVGGGIISTNVVMPDGEQDGDWDAALAVHEFSTGGYSDDETPPGKYVDEDDVEGMLRTLTPKANGAQAGFGTLDYLARAAAKHNGRSLGQPGLPKKGEDIFAGVERTGPVGDTEARSTGKLQTLLDGILSGGEALTRPITAEQLAAREFEARRYIFEGILREGNPCVLWGDGGLGKTTLYETIAVGRAVAKLKQEPVYFLGRRIMPGQRTLMLLAEDDEQDTQERLEDICRMFGTPLDKLKDHIHFWCVPSGNLEVASFGDNGEVEPMSFLIDLCDWIEKIQPDVLLLDTVLDFFQLNENLKPPVNKLGKGFLTGLGRKYGLTALTTAHPTKAAQQSGVGYGGSVAWKSGFRQMLVLKTPDNTKPMDIQPKREIHLGKVNFAQRALVEAWVDDDGMFRSAQTFEQYKKESEDREMVLETMRDMAEDELYIVVGNAQGQKFDDLAEEIKTRRARTMNAATVKRHVSALERGNEIYYQRAEDGKYRPGYRIGMNPDGTSGKLMAEILEGMAEGGRKGAAKTNKARKGG